MSQKTARRILVGYILVMLVAIILVYKFPQPVDEVPEPASTHIEHDVYQGAYDAAYQAAYDAAYEDAYRVAYAEAVEVASWYVPLSDAELDLVERVVAAECANQPYTGQLAVAQCILDRMTVRGMSPTEVVTEPYQFAKPSGSAAVTDSVRAAVYAVFHDGIRVSDEPILFFYSTVGGFVSKMHESKNYLVTIDDHKFFN